MTTIYDGELRREGENLYSSRGCATSFTCQRDPVYEGFVEARFLNCFNVVRGGGGKVLASGARKFQVFGFRGDTRG
jgi:hypothetical protein